MGDNNSYLFIQKVDLCEIKICLFREPSPLIPFFPRREKSGRLLLSTISMLP